MSGVQVHDTCYDWAWLPFKIAALVLKVILRPSRTRINSTLISHGAQYSCSVSTTQHRDSTLLGVVPRLCLCVEQASDKVWTPQAISCETVLAINDMEGVTSTTLTARYAKDSDKPCKCSSHNHAGLATKVCSRDSREC